MPFLKPSLLVSAIVFVASSLVVMSSSRAEEPAKTKPNPLAPIVGAENLHMPFESEECSACHEGEMDAPGPIQEGGDDLCFLCHEDIEEARDEGAVKHNEAGTCLDCHNPHSSNQPALLHAAPRELCLSCHQKVGDAVRAATEDHQPMDAAPSCVACHTPHASEHKSLLVAQERSLCMSCHNGTLRDDNGHVLANMEALLKARPVQHKPIAEQRCATCHTPHGGVQRKLLTAPYPSGFYARFSRETYGLCFQCHDDKLVTESVTQTATAFRDGEKNLHAVHVMRGDRGRSCRACHDVHAAQQRGLVVADVAFGSHGWRLPLNYEKTVEGGNCTKTCHLHRAYSREP